MDLTFTHRRRRELPRHPWIHIVRLAAVVACLSTVAVAQPTIDDVLVGVPDPIRIALPPTEIRGDFPHAKEIAGTVEEVLTFDLGMSRNLHKPNFAVLKNTAAIRSLAQREAAGAPVDYDTWKSIGAEYVLRLAISGSRDQVAFEMWIEDIAGRRRLRGRKVPPTPVERFRAPVHGLSDWIVKQLARFDGIAQTRLAFIRKIGNIKEIYQVDYDGHSSSVMPITNFGTITLSPAWSPDGRALAYVSFRKGWADVYLHRIYDPVGIRFQEFAKYKGSNITPAWNPADPNELAVSLSWTGSPEIYLMSASPKKVTARLTDVPGIDCSPVFSPDGSTLAWTSDRLNRRPQIFVMGRDGKRQRRISRVPGMSGDLAAWSPVKIGDSYRIAFYAYKGSQGHIHTMKPDGTDLRQITSGAGNHTSPSWSPDGMYLAYSSNRHGLESIYVCSHDGSPPPGYRQHLRLSPVDGALLSPVWSP